MFAGCDAYRRACRAAWRLALDLADDQPVEKLKRRVLLAAKVNNAPDVLRLAYRIEGVELPGGISTSRVRFLPAKGESEGEAQAGAAAGDWSAIEVQKWLAAQLATGPKGATTLKKAAGAAGIGTGPLYRASTALGIQREDVSPGSQKLWRL